MITRVKLHSSFGWYLVASHRFESHCCFDLTKSRPYRSQTKVTNAIFNFHPAVCVHLREHKALGLQKRSLTCYAKTSFAKFIRYSVKSGGFKTIRLVLSENYPFSVSIHLINRLGWHQTSITRPSANMDDNGDLWL